MDQSGKSEHTYILTSENKKHVMETVKYIKTKIILSFILSTIVFTGCERDLSDDVVLATFDTTGEKSSLITLWEWEVTFIYLLRTPN